MLAFGIAMLASVAAAPPPSVHALEKLASTYDEASCDAADGGECADETAVEISLPSSPAILDCESPFIAEMIGSCDLPKPTMPSLHLPTVRNAGGGGGFSVARNGSHERLTVVPTASSLDAAMPLFTATLQPAPASGRLLDFADTASSDVPRSRLDRPPRA
ncbi:MAG: hypothetical protein JWM53_5217 [bacterium]|nr:hypothetical protein [bacterium]